MANDRKVTLTLAAQTTGLESITKLSAQLREMATGAGDAGPAMEKLAADLEQSAIAQANQSRALKVANDNLAATKTAVLEARAALSSYTASIGGVKAATADQNVELARLNQAVLASKAAHDGAKASVSAVVPELKRLKAATQAAVVEAEKLTQAVSKPGDAALDSAKKAESAFSGLAGKLRGLAGPLLAAFGGAEFFKANAGLESLTRSMEMLTGSSKAAAEEIAWLKAASNRLGIDVQGASSAYVNLTAAAKGTALEGAQTRGIFEAVAGAMSKLGKSSADTEGALQAVAQMMSKGVVSQEEMRQQLGERLPGAMQATADAAGVTVSELNDMIGTGTVLAADLLPKLRDGLNKLYGSDKNVDGLTASFNRLKNSVNDTFTFIGDSGVASATVAFLGQVAAVVRGLTAGFALLGQSIGITLGSLATFDWKHPIDSVTAWRAAVVKAADDLQLALDKANGKTQETAASQAALAASGKVVAATADAQAVSWLAVVNAYGKVSKASQEATALALKNAEAVAAEQKASVELAAGLGTETDKRTANLSAALANTEALQQVAEARRIEAAVAASNAIALQEAAKGEATLSDEKRKAIQTATEAANAKKLEADSAAAAALSSQQHAAVLVIESAALQDNSKRVDELKAAYLDSAKALDAVRAARLAGNASLAEEQSAAIEAGKAAALYRDALKDVTTAIETAAKAKAGQLGIDQAGIKLAIEQQNTILATARARGDEYSAIVALTEIKRLEVKLSELTAQAKKAEAEAALLTVKARREELQASGELTAAKEAELKAQEASAKVKQVEAQIAGEVAARMKDMADAFFFAGDAADSTAQKIRSIGDAARDSVDGVDSLTSSLNGMNSAGSARAGGGGSFDLGTELKRMGVTGEQAKNADSAVFAEKLNAGLAGMTATNNPLEWSTNAQRIAGQAAQAAVLAGMQKNTPTATGNAPTAPQMPRLDLLTPSAPSAPQATPVHITIGGRSNTVNVASAADANQLTNILRLLETDSARAF